MANVQLFQPFNLSMHSNLGRPSYGWSGDWMQANYPGGIRVSMHDRHGNDSGYYDALKITRSGAPALEMTGFSLDANGSWAEDAAGAGDLRPFLTRIMAGADRVTGSAGADVVNGHGGADRMNGGGGNDWLIGGAESDSLVGGGGNDTLAGGDGDDLLSAGQNTDVVNGGAGFDRLVLATGGNLRIDLAATTVQGFAAGSVRIAGVEGLTTGAGDDALRGTGGGNLLDGGAGADSLWGLGGNDRLMGGTGADLLLGGAGADRFVFREGDGLDRIRGFENGSDRIEIASGGERFADLRITDAGAHAVIAYGADRITIENLDHRLIDALDFVFV